MKWFSRGKKGETNTNKTTTDQKGKFIVVKWEKGASTLYAAFTEKEWDNGKKETELKNCGVKITKNLIIEKSIADVNEIFTLKNDRKNRDPYINKVKEYLGEVIVQTKETPADTQPTKAQA